MGLALDHVKRLVANSTRVRVILTLLLKLWRNRRYILRIAVDLLQTRRDTSFLRHTSLAESRQVLNLFVVDDDSIYGLKLMAFISQALRLRGWHIQVVLRNRSMILGRAYFLAFGIRHFVYLEDQLLADEELALCRRKVQEFLDGPLSLQDIKSWIFEGCWIGPQIISTLSRIRFEGRVDFAHPEVLHRLKEILMPALEHVLRAHKLIEKHRGDLALTIEANYAVFGPLVDVSISRGSNVIQMIQPWKDDALTFRRLNAFTRRDHPSSVSRETLDLLMQMPWTTREQEILNQMFQDRYSGRWFLQKRNQPGTDHLSSKEIMERFELDPNKPTAVIFSQVLWDANLFYGDDLFEDAGEWFLETVLAACANPAMNWLIKLHPANIWKREYEGITQEYTERVLINQAVGKLPAHVKLIADDDNISTHSLFESIDFGITIRGTSGMELVCFGKHCVTAGTGRYSGLGFTLDSMSREQYLGRLANLQKQSAMSEEEVLRAKWHAYGAFVLRPWPMRSARARFAYLERGRGPLDHNLELTAVTLDQLTLNADLRVWADWATGADIDFIQPEVSMQTQ